MIPDFESVDLIDSIGEETPRRIVGRLEVAGVELYINTMRDAFIRSGFMEKNGSSVKEH